MVLEADSADYEVSTEYPDNSNNGYNLPSYNSGNNYNTESNSGGSFWGGSSSQNDDSCAVSSVILFLAKSQTTKQ